MLHNKLPMAFIFLCVLSVVTSCGSKVDSAKSSNSEVVAAKAVEEKAAQMQKLAAQNSLKSLRKMAGAVKMGISFQEYGSRMIDLKSDVDEQVSQFSEGELKQEVVLALEAYMDAKTAWMSGVQYEFLMGDFEPVKSLMLKYDVPKVVFRRIKGTQDKSVTLSVIWKVADEHIAKATQLLNKQ